MAVLWYEPDIDKDSTEMAFLVRHSPPLRSLRFRENERLLIDGPYGQDLNLEYFESVMLTAHGAGILGVLSIARSLWERRRSDDVLRRVNIFWSLGKNSQGEWAATYLRRLQKLDARNVGTLVSLLVVDVLTLEATFRGMVRLSVRDGEERYASV